MPGDLYDVLGVPRTASQAEIKKAYQKLCLKLHPDKNPEEDAKARFQDLQKVYSILSNAEKRAVYDQTGITDDEALDGGGLSGLAEYYRNMFKRVTEEDLDAFYDEYRGSESERSDLLRHYEEFNGDMDMVFAYVMCCDQQLDSHRFRDAIRAAIDAGTVKAHKTFKAWAKQVDKMPAPSDPLKQRGRRKRTAAVGSPSNALVASVRAQNAARHEALIAKLEAKYAVAANGKKNKKRRNQAEEPTEEEFQAARARVEAAASGKGKGHKGRASAPRKPAQGAGDSGEQQEESEDASEEEEKENKLRGKPTRKPNRPVAHPSPSASPSVSASLGSHSTGSAGQDEVVQGEQAVGIDEDEEPPCKKPAQGAKPHTKQLRHKGTKKGAGKEKAGVRTSPRAKKALK